MVALPEVSVEKVVCPNLRAAVEPDKLRRLSFKLHPVPVMPYSSRYKVPMCPLEPLISPEK
jgi:hypothetical protein